MKEIKIKNIASDDYHSKQEVEVTENKTVLTSPVAICEKIEALTNNILFIKKERDLYIDILDEFHSHCDSEKDKELEEENAPEEDKEPKGKKVK